MTVTAEDLVRREVHYCVSGLVSTLAQADFTRARSGDPMTDLIEQAMELTAPIEDWEEAARQAGWIIRGASPGGSLPDRFGLMYQTHQRPECVMNRREGPV